jgi:hypothetical protein
MGSEQLDHSSQFRNGAYARFAVFFPTRAGQLGGRGNALRAGWDGSDPEKFMANEEQVDRLKQDVKAWNEWRSYSPIAPDLREAKLAGMDLRTSWLVEADLGRADLKGTVGFWSGEPIRGRSERSDPDRRGPQRGKPQQDVYVGGKSEPSEPA